MADKADGYSSSTEGDRLAIQIAEFQAIRTDMTQRQNLQVGIVVGSVAATAAVIAAPNATDLLAFVAGLTFILSVLYASQWYWINEMSSYFQEKLWPSIEGNVGFLPSWEVYASQRHGKPMKAARIVLFEGIIPFTYMIISIVAAAKTWENLECWGKSLTIIFILFTLGAPLCVGLLRLVS